MSFLKRIFGKGKSKEEKAKDFLLSYSFVKAISIRDIPAAPVDADTLVTVAEQLISEGKLPGRMVGKKGWYLPRTKDDLLGIFKRAKKEPVKLKDLAEEFGLNRKRTVIALRDQLKNLGRTGEYVLSDEHIVAIELLKNKWRSALSNFDLEEEVTLEDVIGELEFPELTRELAIEWMREKSSSVVMDQEGRIRRRSEIPELVVEKVKELWEGESAEISFEMIGTIYGISTEEAGEVILKLVNDGELDDVTVYAADELIKRRSSH